MDPERIYITTPIYYVNASPHMGHAQTSILCDTMRRYYDLMGYETRFLTGTDEHGEKIMQAAAERGEAEQEFVDEVSERFRKLWPLLHVDPDDFIRTTEPRHKAVVQAILAALYEKGDIYKAEYEGVYCVQCERFYTDKEIEPSRPGVCPTHETPLKTIREENYFFRMGKYQDWLRGKIETEPDFINPPQFANEVLGILREPIGDLCISRPKARVSWGIPLPFDGDYVAYVWFDALVNYLSAVGYPGGELYARFWPSVQHVIGKDILRPHALYWPTMLKALDAPIYQRLHVHGYWMSDGKKMSKTLGNVVKPLEMVERYGAEAFRYFLMREMPLGSDGNFTEAAFIRRFNSDLANDFGNLVSRVAAMIGQFCEGKIPPPGELEPPDVELLDDFEKVRRALPAMIERARLSDVIETIMQAIRATNRYVDQRAPWDLARRKDRPRLNAVLYTAARAAAAAAGLLWPVMPMKCDEALECFGAEVEKIDGPARWRGEGVVAGGAVRAGQGLFPRLDQKTPGEQPAGKAAPKAKPAVQPEPAKAQPEKKPVIAYDDFARLDLRVATIVMAEKHPKADRLLRLEVDLGSERRQVVAGIAEHFAPKDLIGRQVVIVANLAPRNLRGVESHGMILAAHDSHGLRLVSPSDKTEPGAAVS